MMMSDDVKVLNEYFDLQQEYFRLNEKTKKVKEELAKQFKCELDYELADFTDYYWSLKEDNRLFYTKDRLQLNNLNNKEVLAEKLFNDQIFISSVLNNRIHESEKYTLFLIKKDKEEVLAFFRNNKNADKHQYLLVKEVCDECKAVENKVSSKHCPVCNEIAYIMARDFYGTSYCRNNHVWHTCIKCKSVRLGEGGKSIF